MPARERLARWSSMLQQPEAPTSSSNNDMLQAARSRIDRRTSASYAETPRMMTRPGMPVYAGSTYRNSGNVGNAARHSLSNDEAYTHQRRQQSDADQEQLQRAIEASREAAELEEVMRKSRMEQDELHRREQEAELAVLEESRRRHEEELNLQRIAEQEEEEAIRKAIQDSEREAERQAAEERRILEESRAARVQPRRSLEAIHMPGSWQAGSASTVPATQNSPESPRWIAVRRPLPQPPIEQLQSNGYQSMRIPAHVVNQTSDDEEHHNEPPPPAYEEISAQASEPPRSSQQPALPVRQANHDVQQNSSRRPNAVTVVPARAPALAPTSEHTLPQPNSANHASVAETEDAYMDQLNRSMPPIPPSPARVSPSINTQVQAPPQVEIIPPTPSSIAASSVRSVEPQRVEERKPEEQVVAPSVDSQAHKHAKAQPLSKTEVDQAFEENADDDDPFHDRYASPSLATERQPTWWHEDD